jgi:hypothetical protein
VRENKKLKPFGIYPLLFESRHKLVNPPNLTPSVVSTTTKTFSYLSHFSWNFFAVKPSFSVSKISLKLKLYSFLFSKNTLDMRAYSSLLFTIELFSKKSWL